MYCRVRPLDNPSDAACIKVTGNDTVYLASSEVSTYMYTEFFVFFFFIARLSLLTMTNPNQLCDVLLFV